MAIWNLRLQNYEFSQLKKFIFHGAAFFKARRGVRWGRTFRTQSLQLGKKKRIKTKKSQGSSLIMGGGPGVVVSTAAFHARVRGSVLGLGGLKETNLFLPHPRVKVSIVGSLRDREVACSASDRQGPNFESCVWRTVSSQSSHHPQEVLLAQFSLYEHKGGLKPDSFHFKLNNNRSEFFYILTLVQ